MFANSLKSENKALGQTFEKCKCMSWLYHVVEFNTSM